MVHGAVLCDCVLNPSRNLELSLDCEAQPMIFVQRSVKASEMFLFLQLPHHVTPGWLLPPAVSFTSHFSWLFYLTAQSDFAVHLMGNGEHVAKGKSSTHPHLCLCRAGKLLLQGDKIYAQLLPSLSEKPFTFLSTKRNKKIFCSCGRRWSYFTSSPLIHPEY